MSRTLGVRFDCSHSTDPCRCDTCLFAYFLLRLNIIDIVNAVDPPQSTRILYLDFCMSSLNSIKRISEGAWHKDYLPESTENNSRALHP